MPDVQPRSSKWWTRGLILWGCVLVAWICFWWSGYVPYDPVALYRPFPPKTMLVSRNLDLPGQWEAWRLNPLSATGLTTFGVTDEYARNLVEDESAREWFERLAGQEAAIGYVQCSEENPSWAAVSWMGRDAQSLSMQLRIFRPEGYVRLQDTPVRQPVWRVNMDWLTDRALYIAFAPGRMLATFACGPELIYNMLLADEGRRSNLLSTSSNFMQFVKEDDRHRQSRLWVSETLAGANMDVVFSIGIDSLDITFTSLSGVLRNLPPNRPMPPESSALLQLVGNAPAVAMTVQAEALPWLTTALENHHPEAKHLFRMANLLTRDHLFLFLLDGGMRGRISLGGMSQLGTGLRVPTLLLASPAGDDPAALVQRIHSAMSLSNARYRGAFQFAPVKTAAGPIYVLESRGRDEWVDLLAMADRPAYVVHEGWLLLSSNLAALQRLLEQPAAAGEPAWGVIRKAEGAVTVWMDFVRTDRLVRDAIGIWTLTRGLIGERPSAAETRTVAFIREWSSQMRFFGTGVAGIGGNPQGDAWGCIYLGSAVEP